jgi:hypothetical protein
MLIEPRLESLGTQALYCTLWDALYVRVPHRHIYILVFCFFSYSNLQMKDCITV